MTSQARPYVLQANDYSMGPPVESKFDTAGEDGEAYVIKNIIRL